MSVSKNDKQIAYWLILGIVLVASMLILGSITRLTNSGLSMVTWKPITGVVPPLSEVQWQEEFTKYQTSPEYIKLNYHFTITQFKEIFFWEYTHRLLGRILALVFSFPFVYFILKKKIKSKKLLYHLLTIFFLGGMQGVIGWIMVKSGLRDRPHVSHFWLATHLVTALFLISYIFITVMHLLFPKEHVQALRTKIIYSLSKLLLGFTSLQIIYGAFVAGLKAGKLHQTYPKMGAAWFPKIISRNLKTNGFLSFFEDAYLIVFTHRWLAVVVLSLVGFMLYKAKDFVLSNNQKKSLKFLLIAISIQFLLGVFTILNNVPISLGVLHQFGAMLFLLSVLNVIYFFKDNSFETSI